MELVAKHLVVVYLLLRLAFNIVDSFSWPMDGDLSFLYYISWLMNEHDFLPYRDVHETSFFGTFIFYSSLTSLIGYSTFAFHCADIFFFGVLAIILYRLMKPFGFLAGLFAAGIFGEIYFQYGIGVHLQRDFVALLPAAVALLVSQQQRISPPWKMFIAGLLFTVAACIKPQFGLGLVPVFILISLQNPAEPSCSKRALLKNAFMAILGASITAAAGLYWLFSRGALDNFLDMTFNYLPHYSTINGRNFARQPIDSWIGAGKWMFYRLGNFSLLLVLSFYCAFRYKLLTQSQKYFIFALLALWLLYLSYVPMAGKYWEYHILPSAYFLAMCLGLLMATIPGKEIPRQVFLPVMMAWILFSWFIIFRQSPWISSHNDDAYNRRSQISSDELSKFLIKNLRPGDKVQSHVSHTHGFIFPALLTAHAIPATPYLENYLLYHDIDQPFVTKARHQFLSTLQEYPPRFVIATPTVFFFHGEHTEKVFQPFETWLMENYRPVFTSSDQPGLRISEIYTVYEFQNSQK